MRDAKVALKIVRLDPQSVDEVANAKQINHPNVCRVNHTAACGALRLIEMEYIDGPTLGELMQRRSRAVAACGVGLSPGRGDGGARAQSTGLRVQSTGLRAQNPGLYAQNPGLHA